MKLNHWFLIYSWVGKDIKDPIRERETIDPLALVQYQVAQNTTVKTWVNTVNEV